MRFVAALIYFFIFQCNGKKDQKRFATKTIKMIGKTVIQSFPSDWWPFIPTTKFVSSLEVTGTIQQAGYIVLTGSKTCTVNYIAASLNFKIKPTKFVDFTKSKEYKRLWKRTHRGLHWLPPKPTWCPCRFYRNCASTIW